MSETIIAGWNNLDGSQVAEPLRICSDWAVAGEYLEECAAENGDIDLPSGRMSQDLQSQLGSGQGRAEVVACDHVYFIALVEG